MREGEFMQNFFGKAIENEMKTGNRCLILEKLMK